MAPNTAQNETAAIALRRSACPHASQCTAQARAADAHFTRAIWLKMARVLARKPTTHDVTDTRNSARRLLREGIVGTGAGTTCLFAHAEGADAHDDQSAGLVPAAALKDFHAAGAIRYTRADLRRAREPLPPAPWESGNLERAALLG